MDIKKILAFAMHFLACVLFMFSSLIDMPLEFALMAERRIKETLATPNLF